MGKILEGRTIAKRILKQVKGEVEKLKASGEVPGLAVVLVGGDPASKIYVGKKAATCRELGIYSELHNLPVTASEAELLGLIDRLNSSKNIHGILVQLPLPKQINPNKVIEAIAPEKDVDGFHTKNKGALWVGTPLLQPCTPLGVMMLLKAAKVKFGGKHAVVVGRSQIVGRPMAEMLLQQDATVTICHSVTKNLKKLVEQADIVVSAVGRPHFIKGKWLKKGAVAIDIGMNRLGKKQLVGDIEFEAAKKRCSFITPVPGGVGPMTIAMLMGNTLQAFKQQLRVG